MKIGVIGSGIVGQTLAAGFAKHGHQVTIGSREPQKLEAWRKEKGADVAVGDLEETARFGEIVVVAVAGGAAERAVELAGVENLAGKVVIDTNNPIAGAPVNGVLPYFTGPNDSLMERLQRKAPEARFVKAFSCVGNAFMIDPNFAGGPPTMFICGDDDAAKATVTALLREVGWDAEDVGGVEGARAIEPLCQLWCAPGFLRGQWTHAFKLLKL